MHDKKSRYIQPGDALRIVNVETKKHKREYNDATAQEIYIKRQSRKREISGFQEEQ